MDQCHEVGHEMLANMNYYDKILTFIYYIYINFSKYCNYVKISRFCVRLLARERRVGQILDEGWAVCALTNGLKIN